MRFHILYTLKYSKYWNQIYKNVLSLIYNIGTTHYLMIYIIQKVSAWRQLIKMPVINSLEIATILIYFLWIYIYIFKSYDLQDVNSGTCIGHIVVIMHTSIYQVTICWFSDQCSRDIIFLTYASLHLYTTTNSITYGDISQVLFFPPLRWHWLSN